MEKLRRKISHVTHRRKSKQSCDDPKSVHALVAACATLIPTRSNLKSSGQSSAPRIQNYQLVWLDSNIDEFANDNCRNTIAIFRHSVNTVNTFVEVNECIDFLRRVKDDKIILIINGTLGENTMPIINDMSQVISVFILCENKLEHESWTHKWPKIRGVFMDNLLLYEALKQTARDCDRNTVSMSFIKDELDQSFKYTYILKEIISTMNFQEQDLKEFNTYYRKKILGNIAELGNIDKFEREYHDQVPVWWYTYQCLLYSTLNHALCITDDEAIIKLSFFISDLQKYITQLHHKQNMIRHNSTSIIVYRSQGMSQIDFDQLKKTENGFITFNNFLFASKNYQSSFDFARQTVANSDLFGIVFVMTIDPSITSTPFANIRDVSSHLTEEILFSFQSIFRINQIKQIDMNNNRLWQIELTLIDDNDSQFHLLTEQIHEKTLPDKIGWCRLSELLITEKQYHKAEQVCNIAINQTRSDDEKAALNYQLGLIKSHQGEYTEAITYFNLSLKKIVSSEHVDTAECYTQLGLVCEKKNEFSKALAFFEKAMKIYEKILVENDSHLIDCNNNLARMYFHMDEYSKALSYYEKALGTYPPNHLDSAAIHNNISSVYEKMGEYSKAISSSEKTLSIQKKHLPSNHSELAETYNHIGLLYEKLCEYSIALSYYEKSLEIYEEILPSDHLDLATLHNNIGLVYFQRGDYLKALSFHEKAHEIYRKNLPENHPHFASSYVCQGSVYEEMGKYTKALLYYKKAFEIYRNTPSLNPLDLAAFYHAIGSVYGQTCEYTTALSCHKKAFEIYEQNLPANHLDIANSYAWIGDLYDKMGDYLKAYSSYQNALNIGQHSLSSNHPCLQRWKTKLELIKKKL